MEELEKIKGEYIELGKKYNLPKFEQLAEDFDIEKITEKETSFLLREIRRAIGEKITAYLQLFETITNPHSSPMFVFSMLKNSTDEDKKGIKQIYKKLAKFQIQAMKLDTLYNEKKEAEFILQVFDDWQALKQIIYDLIEKFNISFEQESNSTSKGYFS